MSRINRQRFGQQRHGFFLLSQVEQRYGPVIQTVGGDKAEVRRQTTVFLAMNVLIDVD